MPDDVPVFLFPARLFPLTLEAFHPDTGAVVWSKHLPEPVDLTLLHIPPLQKQLGHPVRIRVRWGDGSVSEPE